jgi:hypothetical protein
VFKLPQAHELPLHSDFEIQTLFEFRQCNYESRVNAYRQEYGGIIQLKAVKRKERKEERLQEDRVDV